MTPEVSLTAAFAALDPQAHDDDSTGHFPGRFREDLVQLRTSSAQ